MVAPVPAQISKLRHCPTPRSLRIYPLPTTHCPLSSSHPSYASRGVNIPPVLSSLRILPVATGVYPTTDLRIFRDANSFASYHIPATPAVSCNYALFCATARRYPSYSQQLPHSFCRHGGGTPVASVLRPPDPLRCAFSRSCSLCVFSNLQPLFFSLLSFCQPNSLFSISMRKRPSRFVVRNWILPPSIFGASPCFKQFSTMGCSNMLGTKASSASSSTLLIISRLSRPNRATSMSR